MAQRAPCTALECKNMGPGNRECDECQANYARIDAMIEAQVARDAKKALCSVVACENRQPVTNFVCNHCQMTYGFAADRSPFAA
jgi:hypothetical protein